MLFKRVRSLLSLFVCMFLFVSVPYSEAQDAVTISPEKPQVGDEVTITYNPNAENAQITDADELYLVFGTSRFYELPDKLKLEKNGDTWQTSFKIPEYANYANFHIKSGDTKQQTPAGMNYELLVYNGDKPMEKALISKMYALRGQYPEEANLDSLQLEVLEKALEYYPDSYSLNIRLIDKKIDLYPNQKENLKVKAHALIEKELKNEPPTSDQMGRIRMGYSLLNEKAKYDSLEKNIIEKYPDSEIALEELYSKARKEKDSDKKAEMFRKIINKSDNNTIVERSYEQLYDVAVEKGDVDAMLKYAEKWLNGIEPWKARGHNEVARDLVANNADLETAGNFARKAFELVDSEPVGAMYHFDEYGYIPAYVDDSTKAARHKKLRGQVMATRGLIETKKGNFEKAEELLVQANEWTSEKEAQKYLAELYRGSDRPKKAFEVYWDFLLEHPTDDKVRKSLKESYIAYNGSEEGFNDKTAELDRRWREKMTEKFNKERIDEPAPSLASMTDLQGNPVDAKTLEGKILVVDFWATWCGPCKRAFPYLQKVYDKYKDNPNVKFIVLNSAWSNTIKDARKWAKEEDYTFPYYFDKDSKITDAFGVRGIPTTFVVGPGGNTQFKKVGFSGPDMEANLSLQIDMLLEEQTRADAATSKK